MAKIRNFTNRPTINGMIVGGVCDREHQWRRTREIGSDRYVKYLIDMKFLKISEDKKHITIMRKTTKSFPSPFKLARMGIFNQAQDEIGAYRTLNVIALLQRKKIFKLTMSRFTKLTNEKNAPVSDMSMAMNSGNSSYKGAVQQDHLYKKRKKDGDFDFMGNRPDKLK